VGSKVPLMGFVLAFASVNAVAGVAGDKRTILTSGEKVHAIRYQLGQSTLLYFGFKPETVICGNKNYFNIEKIKDGITVQPLSNFSTNLTVINGARKYLFFLTPSGGVRPDGFVDVRWVPPSSAKPVRSVTNRVSETAREIGQKIKLRSEAELTVLQEKTMNGGKRRIFELELKNLSAKAISTREVEVVAVKGMTPLESQATVWEEDQVAPRKILRGRVIASTDAVKVLLGLIVGFRGSNTKIQVRSH
jgi:hypothetical protein